VKKDFRPKTTSKNYVIRLFYFLFSVCLYNLWELVNVILALVRQVDPKTPIIAAKLFGTILFRIFQQTGIGPQIGKLTERPQLRPAGSRLTGKTSG
jgi:putative transposase